MGTEIVLLDGFSNQHIAPGRRGGFVIPGWRLLKPKMMLFADCSWVPGSRTAHPQFLLPKKTSSLDVQGEALVKLQSPVAMRTHYEIANELVTSEPNRSFWPAAKCNFQNLSMFEVRVTTVASHFSLSTAPQTKVLAVDKEEEDELDKALSTMAKHASGSSQHRISKKAPPTGAAASSGTEQTSVDGSESESGASVVGAAPTSSVSKPKPPPAVSSFVWKLEELGVHEIEWGFKRRAKCYICKEPIEPKTHGRAKYAFHVKKFHAYVHIKVLHLIEHGFLAGALSSLQTAMASDPPPHIARQLEDAIRSVQKRL